MASQSQLADAADTLDRAETNNDERKVLWRALSAYDMSEDYEDFCNYLGISTTKPESETFYETVHTAYLAAWARYGWERLQTMIRIGWNGLYLNERRLL